MKYRELMVKTALNPLKRKGLPYKYDLNIYRGCSHHCKYCYATSSHQYLTAGNFNHEIFVKTNIIQALEKELQSSNWRGDIINIGGVCDSYQAGEQHFSLMREVLKLMIKYQNPIIISTKSSLILRDYDLIDQLANKTYVNIAVSITSSKQEIAKKVEIGAALPQERVNILREFAKTKAYTGLHFMPILPFLSTDKKSLTTITKWAAATKVSYMLTGMLYLTGGIKKRYLSFIKDEFPTLLPHYQKLYPRGGALKSYKAVVHQYLAQLRQQYGVNNNYSQFLP